MSGTGATGGNGTVARLPARSAAWLAFAEPRKYGPVAAITLPLATTIQLSGDEAADRGVREMALIRIGKDPR
jgi:hypothetical protein